MSNFRVIKLPLVPESEHEKVRAEVDALLVSGWSLESSHLVTTGTEALHLVLIGPLALEAQVRVASGNHKPMQEADG